MAQKLLQSNKDTKQSIIHCRLQFVLCLKPGILVELYAINTDILDGLVSGSDGIFYGIDNANKPTILWIEFFKP